MAKDVSKRMREENYRITNFDPNSDKGKGCCDPLLTQFLGGEGAPDSDLSIRGYVTIYLDTLTGDLYSDTDGTEPFAIVGSLSGGGADTLYSADDTVGSGRVATLTDTITFVPDTGVSNTGDLLIGDVSATGAPFPGGTRLTYFPDVYNQTNNLHFAVYGLDPGVVVPTADWLWGVGITEDLNAGFRAQLAGQANSVTGEVLTSLSNFARGGDGTGNALFLLDQRQLGATGTNTLIVGAYTEEATNAQGVTVDLSSRDDGDGDAITTVRAIKNKVGDVAQATLHAENIGNSLIMNVVADVSGGVARLIIGEDGSGTEYFLPSTRGTNGQVLQSDGSGNLTFQTLATGDQNPYLDAVQEDVSIASALSVATTLTTLSDPATAPLAHTLADGTFTGQIKEIYTIDVSGNHTVTPANFADGTSITMGANGMLVTLRWNGTAWRIIKNVKTTAPLNTPATINP